MFSLHILFSLLLPLAALSNSIGGSFINPPASGASDDYTGNLLWSLGTIQTLRWATQLPRYNLSLIQVLGPNDVILWDSPIYCMNTPLLVSG
jgi:hypothetical protein